MWCNLFYDKYAGDLNGNGDHHFCNDLTKMITIKDLEDGSFDTYIGKSALKAYNDKFQEYFQLPELTYKCDMFRLTLYTKNLNGIVILCVVIGVNSVKLEKIVSQNLQDKFVTELDFLKQLCRFHLAYTESEKILSNVYVDKNAKNDQKILKNIDFLVSNVLRPVDYTFNDKIENPKELNVELYEYQKCSVNWMKKKELEKNKIYYNIHDEVVLNSVYYDTNTHKFDLAKNKKNLTFNGGAIIDEVGLGKTLQVITLGLVNPPRQISYKRADISNKFVSKATLILCPNQLCGQWLREFRDRLVKDTDVKIIQMMTKRDFNKTTYNDLLDADFVIASFNFLGNPCFTLPWTQKISNNKNFYKQTWSKKNVQDITKVFNDMGTALLSNPLESLYEKDPLIHLIHWHRIVIDEFHEIYKDLTYNYINNLLPFLTSDNKWCVTATPFNQKKCLFEIVEFLTNYSNVDGEYIFCVDEITDYLNDNCFRRNTKDSVKQEHTLPPIKEVIHWLKFSTTERMMYNAYLANENNNKFSVYLRQLCCHPQLAEETKETLANCKTLADMEKMMVHHYNSQVDEAREQVHKLTVKLEKKKKYLRQLERRQKRAHLKKMGFRINIHPEDDEMDLAEFESAEYKKLKLISDDKANGLTLNIKPTLAITEQKERITHANGLLDEATNVLNGKIKTCEFFNAVVERLRKTANKETTHANKCNDLLCSDSNIIDIITNELNGDLSDDDDDEEEMCGICLDEIPENNIGVTSCGHIFCYECLKLTVSKFHSCPYCKRKLSDREIYVLSYERNKTGSKITKEEKNKQDLINDLGTKLANLITYLRESNEHTIIFSQWDDLLRRTGRILKENNIPNVFCRGNCYQRDKAIREFNEDDKIKVIMLSSDSTAAGTNLTKASQVIFIDPIYGDYKFRKGQERQAIGRAHRLGQKSDIKVVRFIIKDSIEEEIYKLNAIEDKKHASDFAKTEEINMN